MKIILTASSPDIDSYVDRNFGRGSFFIVVDPDTMEWQAFPNPGLSATGGAGTLAAQFAAQFFASQDHGSVISGDFGPNAYNALQAAGIGMYLYGADTTIRSAIEHFKAGQLDRVGAPTGRGQHRRG